ncbi:MAG: ArsR family transcriptional regulator [Desulfovibrionaceae bacterium CG1_02_65_16]|nr:MAG: ArsR family transcriptional regulator [Desulfovibrionaceae bacterium CG1_02_65_16]
MDLLRIHKALADETRLRLMAVLLAVELNVGELVAVFGMGQPRVSRHLKILVEAGLVECRREGLRAYYRAVRQGGGRRYLDCAALFFEALPQHDQDHERAMAAVRERALATRRFFDAVAGQWRDLSREILGDFDLAEELAGRLHPGMIVADLGCGPGELLSRLGESARQVIGVDASPRMLELAGARLAGRSNVSLRLGELEHLPLREAEAQAVTLSLVLHHIDDPHAALAEARRVLAPGGSLLVAEFDRHDNEAMRVKYGDARLGVDEKTLYEWLQTAGFSPRRVDVFPVNQGLTVLIAEAAITE